MKKGNYNWGNLEEERCPICNCKLVFRLSGKSYKIKANKHFVATQTDLDKHMYFCSRCTGFQISQKKLIELKEKNRKLIYKEFKDNPLFKTGLLKL